MRLHADLLISHKGSGKKMKITSAQILPTVEIVSIGYNPRRVSAPRRIASVPAQMLNVKCQMLLPETN